MNKSTYKIKVDPKVLFDLQDAKYYLSNKRTNLGKEFIKEYRSALLYLQSSPFTQLRYKDVYCFPLKRFKYMIHFRIEEQEKTITIYAVLSTHYNPNKHWL